MAEAKLGDRAPSNLDDEIEALQLAEQGCQPLSEHERLQQRCRESTPDDRCDTDEVPGGRRQAVKARLQRLLDEKRNLEPAIATASR